MKKVLVLAIIACLAVPVLVRAQEGESPLQVYMKLKTPESFIDVYEAYVAQGKDSAKYEAAAMLAWLNFYELDRNLGVLKAGAANLDISSKFKYASVLLELARYDEAIDLYKQLNEQVPEWSSPWRQRGTAYWKKGEYNEAVKCLNTAIETRKEHSGAYIVLARVYKDMKQDKKALATLEEGLAYYGKDIKDPEDAENLGRGESNLDVQFLYIELLKKAGNKTEYQVQLETLRKLAPGDERLKQYK